MKYIISKTAYNLAAKRTELLAAKLLVHFEIY